MKKKHYIRTIEDIKYCEENGKMLFDKDNKYSFKFDNGRWTEYDVEGNLSSYNTTLFVSDGLHYYEEAPEEQMEATKKDIGKLCIFWNDYFHEVVGILIGIFNKRTYSFKSNSDYYLHCRPLTKAEIQKFMEKAE